MTKALRTVSICFLVTATPAVVEGFAFVNSKTTATTSTTSLASTVEDRRIGSAEHYQRADTVASAYQDLAFLSSPAVSNSNPNQQLEENWNTLSDITSSSYSSAVFGEDNEDNISDIVTKRNIQTILSAAATSADSAPLPSNEVEDAAAVKPSSTAATTSWKAQSLKTKASYSTIDEVSILDKNVHVDAFGFVTKTPEEETKTDDDLPKKNKHIQYPGYRDVMFEYTKVENDAATEVAPTKDEAPKKEGRYLTSIEAAELFMDMFYTQGTKVVPLNDNNGSDDDSVPSSDGIIASSSMEAFQ